MSINYILTSLLRICCCYYLIITALIERSYNLVCCAVQVVFLLIFSFTTGFTGTTERVCLITGNVDSIITVLTFVMEKIKEKPDPNAKTDFEGKNADREKQVSQLENCWIFKISINCCYRCELMFSGLFIFSHT